MDGRTNGWPDGCGGEVTNCSKNLSTVFALRAYAEFGSECESEGESIMPKVCFVFLYNTSYFTVRSYLLAKISSSEL